MSETDSQDKDDQQQTSNDNNPVSVGVPNTVGADENPPDSLLADEIARLQEEVQVDKSTSFHSAFTELSDIVQDLEKGQADVDTLAGKVARAHALAQHCHRKVKAVQMTFETISVSDSPFDD